MDRYGLDSSGSGFMDQSWDIVNVSTKL